LFTIDAIVLQVLDVSITELMHNAHVDFLDILKILSWPRAVLRNPTPSDPYRMFLGLPIPLVRGPDPAPDPSIIKQK
jgi:hypothetical protein